MSDKGRSASAARGPGGRPSSGTHAVRRSSDARWPFSFRDTIRLAFVASLVFALVEYLRFWEYVRTGAGSPAGRPGVADAFLPLGGLVGLKTWLATGYFDSLHPIAIVSVVAIVATAWLFRRAPCAWLCPLGMASEYLAKLGRRLFGRNVSVPLWLDRTLLALKYAGTFLFLVWLLSAPIGSVQEFMGTPFYAVADMKLFDVYARFGLGVITAVGVIAVVSVPVKSAWCRYLCPYGALQGIFGALSPIVLAKRDSTCTGCARCNRACPNGVDIAGASGAVVSAECMGCTSCVSTCPRAGTLQMKLAGRTAIDPVSFGLFFAAAFMAIVLLFAVSGHFGSALSPQEYRAMVKISSDVHLRL